MCRLSRYLLLTPGLLLSGLLYAQSGPLTDPPPAPSAPPADTTAARHDGLWPKVLVTLLSTLFGGTAGFIVSRLNQGHAARRTTTLALYEKFYSNDLLAKRMKASRLIKRDKRNLDALAEDGLISDYFDALNTVLHFFHQAESLRQEDALDNDLARSLLGRFIRFWYRHAYAQLAAGLDARSERWDLLQRFHAANEHLGTDPASEALPQLPESAGSAQPS